VYNGGFFLPKKVYTRGIKEREVVMVSKLVGSQYVSKHVSKVCSSLASFHYPTNLHLCYFAFVLYDRNYDIVQQQHQPPSAQKLQATPIYPVMMEA